MSNGYTIDFEDQEPASSGYHIQFQDQPAGEQAPGPNWAERLHQAAKYGVFGWGGMLLARDPDPNAERRTGSGIWDAIKAGYQGSASGMILRGDLPTVTLDPHHTKWYERALSQATGVISDLPEMAAGGLASALAGVEAGPGALALGAAGAFAVPTAIRSALTQAYSKGRVKSAGDFLARTCIVIKDTGESALVGGATGAAGAFVGKALTPALARSVEAGTIGKGAAGVLGGAAKAAGEGATMTVAPAVLEGRLPEKQDFLDAAVLIGGLHLAGAARARVANGLMKVWEKTNIPPLQVAADAKADPTILADLTASPAEEGAAPQADAGARRLTPREALAATEEFVARKQAEDPEWGATSAGDPDRVAARYLDKYFLEMPEELREFWRGRAAHDAETGAVHRVGVEDETSDGEVHGAHVHDLREEVFQAGVPTEGQVEGQPVAESTDEVPRAYQAAAARQAAADAFPGEKALQVLDQPFADIPETKLPHQLNMSYISGPDDLRALEARMAEVYEPEINAARQNVQTWAETEQKAAEQYASMTGAELEKVLAGRNPGDTANAVELKIRGDILMQATVEAAKAVKIFKDAGLDATDAMKSEALAAIHRLAMIQADFTGSASEIGRALQYMQRIKELRAQGEGVSKLVELYGSDPETLLRAVGDMTSPEGVAKMARAMNKATRWDMFVEFYKAALVSGPLTQMANILGNTTMMATRPIVDVVAAAIGRATNAQERVRAAEPLARIVGDLQGVAEGLRIARAVLGDEPVDGKMEKKLAAIPGETGKVIRTPFRILGAADALFRTMIERGEANALATRQAIREGHHPSTREFRERVVELATNPTEAMAEAIKRAGERGTFNSPMGDAARAVSTLVRKTHLEPLVPFIATPMNVFKEMARLSPAAPMLKEWRADVAAGGASRAKAVAEMGIGYGVSALTVALANAGLISGGGSPDPSRRRTAQAGGWQPYSVKIGNTWYSFQRIQPVGTLLGMAADVAESWEYLSEGEGDKATHVLGIAFANAITNQTFLQGIADVTGALAEPDRRVPRLLQNTATAVIPSALSQTAQIIDPYQREINSILDAAAARVPGLRQTLNPQRDAYGEEVPSQERLGGILPVATREESTDKVRTEMARLKVGVALAPRTIGLPTAGLDREIGRIELTPDERDLYAVASGHMAHRVLTSLVNRPSWDALPDDLKRKAIETVFDRSRLAGRAAALPPERLQSESVRIADEIHKRLSSPEAQ